MTSGEGAFYVNGECGFLMRLVRRRGFALRRVKQNGNEGVKDASSEEECFFVLDDCGIIWTLFRL
jgi:hypothetical protein